VSLKPFKFKQFTVEQDRCAMKVGTDGVLLGAWASLEHNPQNILDIGTGTGIISLMLAQRSLAENIDAVEIDDNAYEQAMSNFENSLWADRLFCYHAAIQEFASEMDEEENYDLIISNPPFYSEDYKTQNAARNLARFTEALPFQHLIVCASHLLSKTGKFVVILPKAEVEQFIQISEENKLFLCRKCEVRGTETSIVKRVLLEFGFNKGTLIINELTIEKARHIYTDQYTSLVQDFYLKM
jgi:tRNA1Val (adenine37-N6)-methyltransferase